MLLKTNVRKMTGWRTFLGSLSIGNKHWHYFLLGKVISILLLATTFLLISGTNGFAVVVYKSVSGYLTSKSLGTPIRYCEVAIIIDETFPFPTVDTDANGYFQFDYIPQGSNIEVGPFDSYWNVKSSPESSAFSSVVLDVTADFEISPGVVAYVDGGLSRPSYEGAYLYAGGHHVATFTDYTMQIFYPDDYYLGYTGSVYMALPFHKFSPQDQGQYSSYDCTNRALVPTTPVQMVDANYDISALYSWDNPGGTGFEYFPATPDNRMPNNPNIFVSADFSTKGFWPASRIRLNGVHPTNDLTDSNGHTAEFIYPIPACGPHNFRFQVQYLYGSSYQWQWLTDSKSSGASNADLVVDPLNTINVSDIAAFAPLMGRCDGAAGYNACADFFPSGCIDLSDLSVLIEIFNTPPPNKQLRDSVQQGEIILTENFESTGEIAIKSRIVWDAAVVRFKVPGVTAQELDWFPSEGFIDRSILVSTGLDSEPIFCLVVLGSRESGDTYLGSLISRTAIGIKSLEIVGIEVGSNDLPLSQKNYPGPGSFRLGDPQPNPFNPMTTISFNLPERSNVKLAIFDLAGRLVRTLISGDQFESGYHEVEWNGKSNGGIPAAGGVYLYKLDAGQYSDTKRMTLLK